MNRLVIIGNGFDLAHGLATSYKDFISWYFNVLNNKLLQCTEREVGDALCSIKLKQSCEFSSLKKYLANHSIYEDVVNQVRRFTAIKVEDSGLVKEISRSLQTKKWVDIEQDYYNLLTKQCENSVEYLTKTDKLNNDLECLKRHLFDYLSLICSNAERESASIYIPSMIDILMAPIKKEDVAVASQELWIQHVDDRMKLTYDEMYNHLLGYNLPGYDYEKLENFIKSGRACVGYTLNVEENIEIPKAYAIPDRTMLLNFNYTDVADQYMPKGNPSFEINHIHGSIADVDSMIFGYGDELDENYKNLENKNDNEYLKNMKSIRYQETDNYRRMLSFIESAPYQIFLLGHSCGISDRTLLNTLFEHKNCASIKPFYYQEGVRDNYNDIIASISRNFTDMKKMRDRVVNKTYCQPLPQAKKITSDE